MGGRVSGSVRVDTLVVHRAREMIIYDADVLDAASARELLTQPGHVLQGGRGGTEAVRRGGLDLVRRRFRRGGWMSVLGDRYLRACWRTPRPLAEWSLLHGLVQEGLPVPRPLAARAILRGIWYRGEILMIAVAGQPLTLATADVTGAGSRAAAAALGRIIRRLHAAGIDHPDLHVGNVLVRDRGLSPRDYTIVDFDRAKRRPRGRWMRRNLARFERSLARLPLPQEQREAWWRSFLEGYDRGLTDAGGA